MRVFRVIRVFRLLKIWKGFYELLKAITKTLIDMSNISVLILILVFTYTLLGMEIFAYRVKFDSSNRPISDDQEGEYPKFNFNGILNAFISVFIVLANDGWTNIYYDHYRATEPVSTTIFFLSLLVVGQYILLNLFIAIMI